jgi:dihydroorotate dehydrogenase
MDNGPGDGPPAAGTLEQPSILYPPSSIPHPPSSILYKLLRPLLFRLDAEAAHRAGMVAARAGQRLPGVIERAFRFSDPRLEQTLWAGHGGPGLLFRTPIGLAAGFDKNGEVIRFWGSAGLGFVEVGSVTARASAGNPRPRAFRLPDDHALINRMGLNNDGAVVVARRLAAARRERGFVVGVNVAKTHDASILGAEAVEDFRQGVAAALPVADYVALNVSCPNTGDGRTFEEPAALDNLLAVVARERAAHTRRVPLLVKLSPPPPDDAEGGTLNEIVSVCRAHGVDGLIATNTAPDRAGCTTDPETLARVGRGGLSGRPLAGRAHRLVRHLYRATGGALPIIGVGGIDSADEAYRRIRAGASLVQLYTALVYEGPGLVPGIGRGLIERLERDGLSSVADAVGLDA